MVLAYHLILSAYGFWLPNDPRGSWSTWVGSWELFRYGPATKVDTRHSVAGVAHDRAEREEAKRHLKYPPVIFNGHQAMSIARGFAIAADEGGYHVHACAILPEHLHIVVARSARDSEDMITHFKTRASRQLNDDRLHPLATFGKPGGSPPTPWSAKGWSCYIDTDSYIERAIEYVERNPEKEGKRRQHWDFVIPYRG